MLNRKAIEKRLKGVDPQLCAAFAARCSLRVLPLLGRDQNKKAFWYWDSSERSTHLLALFKAQQFSINCSVFCDTNHNVYAAAAVATTAAATTAAAAAAYAADTKVSVAYAAAYTADTAVDAAYAAVAAAAAAADAAAAAAFRAINIDVEAEICFDLDKITKKTFLVQILFTHACGQKLRQ